MRCTSCNEPTRVLETRHRPDGAIRRRRQCRDCGRRFTSVEQPDDWMPELPEVGHGPFGGGPLEAVRRRAILAELRDENDRALAEVEARIERNLRVMERLNAEAEARLKATMKEVTT